MAFYHEISLAERREGQRRIKEIDELRVAGGKTELEIWWRSIDTRKKKEAKKVKESYLNLSGYRIYVAVIDEITLEEKHYTSLKQACEEHKLSYESVKGKLKRNGREANVGDITVIKLAHNEVKEELLQKESRTLGNKKWSEKDTALLVRKRLDGMAWYELDKFFKKSKNSCVGKFNRVKNEGMIDYYLNLEIEEVNS